VGAVPEPVLKKVTKDILGTLINAHENMDSSFISLTPS
jgi:hypothetical protein